MTQEGLARRSGISRETISRIETGRREEPEILTLAKLAEALDVTIFDLMVGPALLASVLKREGVELSPDFSSTSPRGGAPHVGVTSAPYESHEQRAGGKTLEQ